MSVVAGTICLLGALALTGLALISIALLICLFMDDYPVGLDEDDDPQDLGF